MYKFRFVLGQTFLELSYIVLPFRFMYVVMGFPLKSVYEAIEMQQQ